MCRLRETIRPATVPLKIRTEENLNYNMHVIVLGSMYLTTGDTSYITSTVLDADSSGSGVICENGEDEEAEIVGLTIKNGVGGFIPGGGVYCLHSRPTVKRNRLTENYPAIHCLFSSPLILDNYIFQNITNYRGVVFCKDSSNAVISGNYIIGNSNQYAGYGVINCEDNSDAVIIDNVISMNASSGISCDDSNPVIRNNTIAENSLNGIGAGIYCNIGSNPVISNNYISDNSSSGIICSYSNAVITGNVISENYGNDDGGGISCFNSNPTITYNIIYGNSAQCGGGIACNGSEPDIINNVLSGNIATGNNGEYGGGMYFDGSDAFVINNILWADSSLVGSNEIYISDCFPFIFYCNIQGGWPGPGNIDVDPMFRDPEAGDFHLMSTDCGDPDNSPCIDAGHPEIIDSLLDCAWGLGTVASDMGAFGGGDSTTVNIPGREASIPIRFSLAQSYPNPFNSYAVISYGLPEASFVEITVYDILGRQVAVLVDEQKSAGYHKVKWNAGEYSSGLYFYGIRAGEYYQTRKMLLLK
jgi:hypothetical protein